MILNPIYNPRPGSIADRAMAHLKAHGLTANVPLADAIDADSGAISASLSTAVRFGAVRRETINGVLCWSLGDGAPPAPDDHDDDPIVQRVVNVSADTVPARGAAWPEVGEITPPDAGTISSVAETPSPILATESAIAETVEADGGEVLSAASASAGLRIALWSDGALQLRRSDVDIAVLSGDETRQLIDYLRQVNA